MKEKSLVHMIAQRVRYIFEESKHFPISVTDSLDIKEKIEQALKTRYGLVTITRNHLYKVEIISTISYHAWAKLIIKDFRLNKRQISSIIELDTVISEQTIIDYIMIHIEHIRLGDIMLYTKDDVFPTKHHFKDRLSAYLNEYGVIEYANVHPYDVVDVLFETSHSLYGVTELNLDDIEYQVLSCHFKPIDLIVDTLYPKVQYKNDVVYLESDTFIKDLIKYHLVELYIDIEMINKPKGELV